MKLDVYIIVFAFVASIEARPKDVFPDNPLLDGTLDKIQGASSDVVEAGNILETVETTLQNDANSSSNLYQTESQFTDTSNSRKKRPSSGKLRFKIF